MLAGAYGGNVTSDTIGWGGAFSDVLIPSDAPGYYLGDPADSIVGPPHVDVGVLTDLWYIPREIDVDGETFTLTPVFVTVKEL